jgi:hypothetical protein
MLKMSFEELDWLCERIPGPPRSCMGGRTPADKRKVVAGIIWILDNSKWKDLPPFRFEELSRLLVLPGRGPMRALRTARAASFVIGVSLLGRIAHEVYWPLHALTLNAAFPFVEFASTGDQWYPSDDRAFVLARWLVPAMVAFACLMVGARLSRLDPWFRSRRVGIARTASIALGSFLLVPWLLLALVGGVRGQEISSDVRQVVVVVAAWSTHGHQVSRIGVIQSQVGQHPMPRHRGLPFDGSLGEAPPISVTIDLTEEQMRDLVSRIRSSGFFSLPPAMDLKSEAWGHWYFLVGVYDGFHSHEVIAPWDGQNLERLAGLLRMIEAKAGAPGAVSGRL